MEFIGVFFFPLIGFFMLFFPEDIFEIMNSRRNEANGEPTRSFLIGTRIGGAILMLIGIGGFIALLIEQLSGRSPAVRGNSRGSTT